jgi:hypothetical protein
MRIPSKARDFRHSLDLSRTPLRIKNGVALHIEAYGDVRFSQEGIPWRVMSALVYSVYYTVLLVVTRWKRWMRDLENLYILRPDLEL